MLQLEILKVGVFATGILSPDPFSLVLVMGVRFPTAIELTFGFTLDGIGGILALNRTVDTDQLVAGLKNHFIDRVLFPDDPVAEAPRLLDQVASVFPYRRDGFVAGAGARQGRAAHRPALRGLRRDLRRPVADHRVTA